MNWLRALPITDMDYPHVNALIHRHGLDDASSPSVPLSDEKAPDGSDRLRPRGAASSATPQPKPRFAWKTAALCVLGFVLVLYNGVNFLLMIVLTPKNDFGRTFLSAVAFVQGEEMYGMNPSIPWKLEDGSIIELWNLNPPHFHLLLLPLVWLPAGAALVVWLLANGVCGYYALRLIVREAQLTFSIQQRQRVLLGLLAFIGTASALVTGHMAFLLFLVVTLSWHAARRERWTTSGIWLGLALSVKPFLLFLVPYFLWRRQWRALAALGVTVLLCIVAGFVVFGVENHRAWLHMLQVADNWAWLPMNASVMALLTRTFTDNPIFTPLAVASPDLLRTIWLCAGIPIALLTYAAAFTDSSRRGVDRAFALMLLASLLVSPLGWTYYFWLPVGPMAMLWADWRRGTDSETGVSTWTRRLLKFAVIGLMYPLWSIGLGQPLSLGTVLIGSLYFWGLLLVWLALLIDALRLYFRSRPILASRTIA